ncbi:MAG: tetratricopeptide repeat protein [bacterium]|nr:tetratricopeptide repeat protein [bacterium]
MSSNEGSGVEKSFVAAMEAVRRSPGSADAWDHLEELADELQRPDDVSTVYRDVLGTGTVAGQAWDDAARRAVQFTEEWFGDTPDTVVALLDEILERAPATEWAFERLTVVLTGVERWEQLLDAYDRTLEGVSEAEVRKQLLDDAAQVAKDFAGDSLRAVGYLRKQLAIDVANDQLASSIERLLERNECWDDLIGHWRDRLVILDGEVARGVRVRIAEVYLDQVGEPAQALEELRGLMTDSPGHAAGSRQLERLLALDGADESVRRGALDILRTGYEATKNGQGLVGALETALGFADPETRLSLHREAGERLAILGRDTDAMDHYAALLRESPADSDARQQLRELAARADRHDICAGALVAAGDATTEPAQRVTLFVEAAQLYRDVLQDNDGAIDLYSRVLESGDTEPHVAVSVAHQLEELFSRANRPVERLQVLERLAELERAPLVRRSILGEAARLAEEQGDPDRALSQWRRRLELFDSDTDALDAVVELLERTERWSDLSQALRQRADTATSSEGRRADLVRLATVQAARLEDAGAAIATWQEVAEAFGASEDVLTALDELMAGTERWTDLADLLRENVSGVRTRGARLLARLGDIHRLHLDDAGAAVDFYGRAVRNDPSDSAGREGLKNLLRVDEVAGDAALALAGAFEATGDWQGMVDLVEVRISSAPDKVAQVRVLREAAGFQEQHGQDAAAALALVARALPLRPGDLQCEAELVRLAAVTGDWEAAANALRAAAGAVDAPARARQLRSAEGDLALENGNAERATDAFLAALEIDEAPKLWRKVLDAGCRAGRWNDVGRAFVRHAALTGVVAEELANRLETAAGEGEAWTDLTSAWLEAIGELTGNPDLVRGLSQTIVRWLRGPAQDDQSALRVAAWSVDQLPRDADMLLALSEVQRDADPEERIGTLLRLDAARDGDLDALAEAVRSSSGNRTRELWEQLWSKASRMWLAGIEGQGKVTAETAALAALEVLAPLYDEADEETAAIDVRLAALQLPVAPRELLRLRGEAAERLAARGDNPRAIEQLREIVALNPEDREALATLGDLCRREHRLLELVDVRNRELSLTADIERRIELRLEIAGLVAELEQGDGRVSALMANLDEVPGHPGSVARLTELLESRGRHAELADALADQCGRLDDAAAAARLWEKVAALAESPLGDLDRAIESYERAVQLDQIPSTLDSLARIHVQRHEHEIAASWLKRRLEDADPRDQVSIMLRLARAQLKAQREDEAIANLEAAFAEAPRNGEVRKLLLHMYRTRQAWQPLARALNTAAEAVNDESTVLAYAREAAAVWGDRLGSPEEAVATLERALAFAPEDRTLRRALAAGLRAQGRLEEAAEMLRELIGMYGRRRSPERAEIHLELARVAAQNDVSSEALEQLDVAAKMDAGSVTILHTLASLARKVGELDRAERAYRSLLMNVKRAQGPVEIGASEVLLELGRIAEDRDEPEKAAELIESALEAVVQDDDEAPRLQARLQELGDVELLKRVLESRLERVTRPKRRASVLSQIADLREQGGDEPGALEARLEALDSDPASPPLHEAAAELSRRLDQPGAYEDRLESLLERVRRGSDVQARCELLLRLGQIREADGDFKGAAELYAQAEETGVREIDVWRATARVAGEQDDDETQRRVLEKLASLGEDQRETRVDASYRLAEVQLASSDTLVEGLGTLRRALDDEPRWERVARLLRRASEVHPDAGEVLELYEKAARRSEDPELTLHFLERRAAQADASPEQIKEAADQAQMLGHSEREEALLLRAIDVAEGMLDGRSEVTWALLGLAERRFMTDDMAGAIKWLIEASEVSKLEPILDLGRRIAAKITESGGDLTLAVKLYEHLLDLDRSALEVWRPLAAIYRELGDFARLERLVEETLDSLDDAQARNALRLELAHALLNTKGREDAAIEILEAVLEEEPENLRGQELLADHLQRVGKTDELRQLLSSQLDKACDRRDGEAAKALGVRLSQSLDDADAALDALRRALAVADGDCELLQAVLERLPDDHDVGERASLLDRLTQLADDADMPALAVRTADAYTAGGDPTGAARVLETVYRRVPNSVEVRERLESLYRDREDHAGLVRIMLDSAADEPDAGRQAELLIAVARVQRDDLGDPSGAADTLSRAASGREADVELMMELASTLAAAGQVEDAVARLGDLLEGLEDGSPYRLDVLRRRSDARASMGDDAGALEDLWTAFEIEPDSVADQLDLRLSDAQEAAAQNRDMDAEREVVMRRVEVAGRAGNHDAVRTLLEDWTERQRKDTEALRALRDLETEAQDWEPLIKICSRLIALEEGEEQVLAALRLSYACEQVGRPEDARRGLEHARRKQPDNHDLRRELRQVYEKTGAQAELGQLLLEVAAASEGDEKVDALLRAGQMLATGGGWAQAAEAFSQAFEIEPDDPNVAASLANARIATGEPGEAQRILDEAIAACKGRRSPELATLQQIQARVAAAQGDAAAQLDWLAQAYACDPKNGSIALELAVMAEEREEYDTAIRALRSLAMMKDESPMLTAENYARQGRISLRKGDQKRATLWARKAKQGDPNNPVVLELLAQLDKG